MSAETTPPCSIWSGTTHFSWTLTAQLNNALSHVIHLTYISSRMSYSSSLWLQVILSALSDNFQQPASNPSTPSSSSRTPLKPSYPKPLNLTTSQQLLNNLKTLTPQTPPSTPLSPFIAIAAPLTQSALNRWAPGLLLRALQLCNITGYTPSAEWLAAWAAAVRQQLPRIQSEVACLMVAEVLKLQQGVLPQVCCIL